MTKGALQQDLGAMHTPPAVEAADLARIDEAAGSLESAPEIAAWFKQYHRTHRFRLAQDLVIIDRILDPTVRVIELGSVPPILTLALRRSGRDVIGVDIAPERFSFLADLGLDVRKCDIEEDRLPFDDASVDCLVFNEVFEHLRKNVLFTLKEIHRVLRPGGLLIMSTPNMRSLNGFYAFVVEGRGAWCCPSVYTEYEKLETIGHMGHVREYTPREIRELFEKIGFRTETILYRGSHRAKLARALFRMLPSARPFMTFVARRAA